MAQQLRQPLDDAKVYDSLGRLQTTSHDSSKQLTISSEKMISFK